MIRVFAACVVLAVLSSLSLFPVAAQTPLAAAFTYQGRLNTGGSTASGPYSFQFSLFDSPGGGRQIGATQSVEAEVTGGLFSVSLDFGSSAFTGDKRWLGIAVKSPSEGAYTALTPRVEVSAAPYALHALNAATVGDGSLTTADGNLGIGTDNPRLDLHIRSGDTPAIRLEQNLGGWPPQTWDIGANEANFFVRDITKGNSLPFRIRPGAPQSSLDIAADGKVGIGVDRPKAKLHLGGAAGTDGILFPDQTLQVTAYRRVLASAELVSSTLDPWTSANYTIPAPDTRTTNTAVVNLDVDLPLGLILSNIRSGTDEVHYQIQNISNTQQIVPAATARATVLQ